MNTFIEQMPGIYRLKVPFDTVYTSVFLVCTENRKILVDCATTPQDVDDFIIPALNNLGFDIQDIEYLIITHWHEDHAGGKDRLLFHSPKLKVITEVSSLIDGIETYPLMGHTKDCIGVLCIKNKTLISADGLQGAGVDKYKTCIALPDAYRKSIAKIRADARIENILFSHAYEPWFCDAIIGKETVQECLDICLTYV